MYCDYQGASSNDSRRKYINEHTPKSPELHQTATYASGDSKCARQSFSHKYFGMDYLDIQKKLLTDIARILNTLTCRQKVVTTQYTLSGEECGVACEEIFGYFSSEELGRITKHLAVLKSTLDNPDTLSYEKEISRVIYRSTTRLCMTVGGKASLTGTELENAKRWVDNICIDLFNYPLAEFLKPPGGEERDSECKTGPLSKKTKVVNPSAESLVRGYGKEVYTELVKRKYPPGVSSMVRRFTDGIYLKNACDDPKLLARLLGVEEFPIDVEETRDIYELANGLFVVETTWKMPENYCSFRDVTVLIADYVGSALVVKPPKVKVKFQTLSTAIADAKEAYASLPATHFMKVVFGELTDFSKKLDLL